ncbi:hypothetical protein Tco_1374201, partial [Tanacetum coccineum]
YSQSGSEADENDEEDGGNNDEGEAEVIPPYEEADPLNRPPPTSIKESEFFGDNIHIGESSSTRALLASNCKVSAPGPTGCNLESFHKGVKRLDRQMFDRYNTEIRMVKKVKEGDLRMNRHEFDITALDAAVRENSSDYSKMMKFVKGMSKQFNELKEKCC